MQSEVDQASTERMRAFWDAKARENAMYYIHSELDYRNPDEAAFWESGRENLDRTLGFVGAAMQPGDRVLEIGCGMGRMTRAISERTAAVVGVDVSEEMVRRAQTCLADRTNVEIVLGNGRDLRPLPDATFDAVYSFIVFQHIPDPAVTCGYIAEIGRVLRPGGWTLFQISEQPEIHDANTWRAHLRGATRIRSLLGLAPRGCLEPQWLGSAVSRGDLDAALTAGDLELEEIVGEHSQYCFVYARKRG